MTLIIDLLLPFLASLLFFWHRCWQVRGNGWSVASISSGSLFPFAIYQAFFSIVLSGPGMLPEGLTPVLVSACEVKIDKSHLKRATRPDLQPFSLSWLIFWCQMTSHVGKTPGWPCECSSCGKEKGMTFDLWLRWDWAVLHNSLRWDHLFRSFPPKFLSLTEKQRDIVCRRNESSN